MSEEIKHSGAEMNDAALEGVSGGGFGPEPSALQKAKHYCSLCDHNGFCGNDSEDLAYYIESYGDPGSYTACHYYK